MSNVLVEIPILSTKIVAFAVAQESVRIIALFLSPDVALVLANIADLVAA
jgi:hypothetical protein